MAAAVSEVLIPASVQDAVSAFGDGRGVTIVGGGTIVMPEIAAGRVRPARALLLARAGLDTIDREGSTIRIGATVPLSALVEGVPEPLAGAARRVADVEIRGQATIGGNLCAPPGSDYPRGDLQAPLIALGARVRSAGPGGERTEPVEEFLAGGAGRLVLGVEFEEPKRGSYAALDRPHAHAYTVLSVACAEGAEGVRVAVGGAGPRGQRCPSVEAALGAGASAADAAAKVLEDVSPTDDALASAWYRQRMLPVLVGQTLGSL
jgi:CO/xanthine dehydrogenase FAD-binding subunit